MWTICYECMIEKQFISKNNNGQNEGSTVAKVETAECGKTRAVLFTELLQIPYSLYYLCTYNVSAV